jgi:hypothetical protein
MNMKLPKVIFTNSVVLNRRLWEWHGKNDNFPRPPQLEEYVQRLEKEWSTHGEKILSDIAAALNEKWEKDEIEVYVTGLKESMSSPLMLGYKSDISVALDILTHELIHIFIGQMSMLNRYRKFASGLDEPQLVKVHVVVHAIHQSVYESEGRFADLKRDIAKSQKYPEYAKAWDIVEKRGYRAIIADLRGEH